MVKYEPIYTAVEVAEVLKTNKQKVYEIMDQGILPYIVLGKRKVKGIDLEAFINNYPVENPKEEEQNEQVTDF